MSSLQSKLTDYQSLITILPVTLFTVYLPGLVLHPSGVRPLFPGSFPVVRRGAANHRLPSVTPPG
jgi:hypothetical protein